ncbi:MAG: DUF721 domain-containing protein [SAR324 cluster bacterium]|nr:DUF721 domain-containing protein [SAR324 cluster bacterium]MCZ6558344.1 DUF721 domain-containing protein [SAR324 cluster bacterium]MCZ6844080.1 DUF721 domain-containing protein [SAR324 cluster bacterium]
MQEFHDLIVQLFRERHRQPSLTVTLLRQHWSDIHGAELARKTYPTRLTGGLLWISTVDAGWAYQLQFMKREMLESIQVFMGAPTVKELRFKQGEVPAPETSPRARAHSRAPHSKSRAAIPAPGAEAISDAHLRESFSRWHNVQKRRGKERNGNPQGGPE